MHTIIITANIENKDDIIEHIYSSKCFTYIKQIHTCTDEETKKTSHTDILGKGTLTGLWWNCDWPSQSTVEKNVKKNKTKMHGLT